MTAAGVPAHVTVLYPFAAPDDLDDTALRKVGDIAAGVAPFQVSFAEPAEWPGVVWLRPDPDDSFRALTRAATARFPEHPPYSGLYPDTIPHLTVGQDLDEVEKQRLLDAMRDGLRADPIVVEVRTLALWASDDAGRWRRWHDWPLGTSDDQSSKIGSAANR